MTEASLGHNSPAARSLIVACRRSSYPGIEWMPPRIGGISESGSVEKTHGGSSAGSSSASGQTVVNRGSSTMLEAPSGSGSRSSEGPSGSGTPPESGEGGGGGEPPPRPPKDNSVSKGAYQECTSCQLPTNRRHDVCGLPYCKKCLKEHKRVCKPKHRCRLP